jgi:hypothetical protein
LIAVLIGNWLGGESVGGREIAAMVVILGSVVLLTTAKRPPQKTHDENADITTEPLTGKTIRAGTPT